jgi:acylphosphatase
MSEGEIKAVHLLLAGRVQGVAFRWFTVRQARELGIVGTVANLDDGRVEVKAAGAPAAVEEFQRRLAQGPPAARVTAVDERALGAPPAWTGFEAIG